ncbi:DUF2793 domain-containing protein [Pseudoxanthomonas sp. PXM05]|uniref:DUF2793 domain-containing protein n=1 Tax=Pseudoxanthomonas sp. PXM05 TaxID=2854775 RepID=UPI001C4667EB|nr:DUF2793 domain-containing protein [Pseudoxanthomonas sp. PXM05]MBV7475405.1 DUF2793 domain-containing protein [Pseudoxanthomonas sp. PXM05]
MSTPNLGLELVPSGAEQQEVPVNASLQKLDAIVRPGGIVQDVGTTTPPSVVSGDIGKSWVVGAGATGDWAGHDDDIALLVGIDLWAFITPNEMWRVGNLDDGNDYVFDGSSGWSPVLAGTGVVESVVAGAGVSVDSTDPGNPVVSVKNAVTAVTPAAGVATIDCSLGDYFTIAPTANITSIVFTNLPGSGKGATKMIRFTQDTTPRTVSWPASFKWAGGIAGAVSTGSGAVDVLAITTFDNGTTWDATLAKAFA